MARRAFPKEVVMRRGPMSDKGAPMDEEMTRRVRA